MASRGAEKEDARLRQLYLDVKKRSGAGADRGIDKIRGKGRKVSRDYLASMLIGAGATPIAMLASSKLSRLVHNKEIQRAIAATRNRSMKRALRSKIQKGPMIGPTYPKKPTPDKPLMTLSETAGHGARGAVMGSLVQMLRDRFSGSAGAGDLR